MNRNSILVGLVIFYSIFLGLLVIWDPTGISSTTPEYESGFLATLAGTGDLGTDIANFFTNITANISGFPSIVNVVVFTPLGLMAVWLLVDFIIYITPFIGGS